MIYWQKTNVHGMKCVIESVWGWVGGLKGRRERETDRDRKTDRAR